MNTTFLNPLLRAPLLFCPLAAVLVLSGGLWPAKTCAAAPEATAPSDSAEEAETMPSGDASAEPLLRLPPTDGLAPVTAAQYLSPAGDLSFSDGESPSLQSGLEEAIGFAQAPENLPPAEWDEDENENTYPIDLPTVLRLAGANNLQIALAVERVNEAAARATAANALWIPSFNVGAVWNNHQGQIQDTRGQILDVTRNSLFVGGGAVVGDSPAAAGSSGPARMFVDLSLADAIFEPLAARQLVRASAADRTTTFNDTLLQVSAVYLALVRAQARVAIAKEAVSNAEELAKITRDFAETGRGLQADADRAKVEVAARRRDVFQAEEQQAIISAELARLLRLDPAIRLVTAEENPAPLEFVDPESPLPALIGQAISARPEVRSADAVRDATFYRTRQEQLRPWIPNLYAGTSGGGFGGASGSSVDDFAGRADFDVAAIWELENLGFGNIARQREERSRFRQANLTIMQVRDQIAAEVAQAYQSVQFRQRQIDVTRPEVETAHQSMQLNWDGIRGGELRPIEIQQAIGALAVSRTQYLDAVVDYNVAQFQLLRAIGQPPEMTPISESP